ncbi:MAG: YdbH domain-containing protein [Rhodobacterales bacterium]|nr:YdbH domain-containing protein [Rhodobacterales bacterium]
MRWASWPLLGGVLLILIGVLAGWVMRKPLAAQVLAGWCRERDLTCAGQFEKLDLAGATIGGLTVSGQGNPAFEARRAHVQLAWPGLFTPRVTRVEVDAPVVYGALSEGRLGFHGLERLATTSGGGGGGTLPAMAIRDGRIVIATSAGDVVARIEAEGLFPEDATATVTLEPASLDEAQGYLRWSGGAAHIEAKDGQLEGHIDLSLEEVRTDQVQVSGGQFVADMKADTGNTASVRLVWEGHVSVASGVDFELADLQTSGRVLLDKLSDGSVDGVLEALREADIQLDTGKARWTDYASEGAYFETSLRKTDDVFAGPSELILKEASLPQGRAAQLNAAGELAWAREDGGSFDGQVSASNGTLAEDFSESLLGRVTLPAPLTAHGASLKAVLHKAFADFGVQGRVKARLDKGGYHVEAWDEASLTAASGLAAKMIAMENVPWLRLGDGAIGLRGDFSLRGGGAPRISARVESLAFGASGLQLSGEDLHLTPWLVAGTAFGADVSSLSVNLQTDDLTLRANGAFTLTGPAFGVTLAESRLSGAVQVTRQGDDFQVQPVDQPCLRFDTQGVTLGGVVFQPNKLKLCARNGDFMAPANDQVSGTAALGDVSWPFASPSVSGVLKLSDTSINWSASKGFSMTLSAPDISLPMEVGDRVLTIDAANPRVRLVTAKGKVPGLVATLGDTVFGGTLIPAKVSANQISFNGGIGGGGLSGDLAGRAVLIRDFRDDPVYQPLLSDLTAHMHEWQMALTGPLRLQANNVPVGDIQADINVLTLDGTARVATRMLEFRKGGLQPVMLSELLRGVYTDAVGQMEAVSDVTIDGGRLAGTADVSVSDFGFQTTRLGRVQNVNGQVHFSDLFTLSTDPTQVLTVGAMNPGVPLNDGRLVFGLSGGKVLVVESAAFPFSGGTLALDPFNWTLGAETQHVEVTADEIDLTELVSTLNLPKIEAEGTVSGRFPIDIERSKVLIRNARLFADDGGGRLAYLGDAADSAARSDANVRLAFEALKDFDFTVLEVGLDGDVADRVTITLKLAGKSRNDITYGSNAQIVRGQPFEFNIAVDSALAELFRSSQFYTNQQKLTDFVVEEVLTDRGLKIAEDE